MCVASCGRKLDTQGAVPSHNKLCFTSAHPCPPEQEVTLMLSCKCSALQPSEGHYKKGPWHPPLYPSPSVHLMSHTWPDYLVSPTWYLYTLSNRKLEALETRLLTQHMHVLYWAVPLVLVSASCCGEPGQYNFSESAHFFTDAVSP